MRTTLGRAILPALFLLGGAVQAEDRTAFNIAFQDKLAAAEIGAAAELAQAQLAAHPGDAQAQFALGAAEFLGAVETLGQGLYQRGLTPGDHSVYGFPTVTSLPFLRLPVGENPAPLPFSAAVFRDMLVTFDAGMTKADAALAQVAPGPVKLRLDLNRVSLDFNGNGKPEPNEALPALILSISGMRSGTPLRGIAFDESDVPWLRGYSHLLTGLTNIVLAHDFSAEVDQTFQSAFPDSRFPSSPLEDSLKQERAALKAAKEAGDCVFPSERTTSQLPRAESEKLWDRYLACSNLETTVEAAAIGDLVAFVHLLHWPVVEPARLLTARQDFLTMIALSRQSWALIQAETDDDQEWVPSPRQTGPFPTMRVTDQTVAGWLGFLDEAEGVLNGTYLIPHWRFDPSQGMNIRRMFEAPRTLDPILLLTGQDAIPYMEKGTLAPDSTMDTGLQLLDGGLLAYFLWFN